MIRLKSLSVSHFKSFGSTQRVEFPATGLVQLKALPFNESLSGIGKSNLLKAVDYCVTTGQLKDNTKNWYSQNDDKICVETELLNNEDLWRIKRGTFSTELYLNEVKFEGGAKAVNQKIQKLFGLDFDLISQICFRRQRKGNGFINSTDSEKKEFLSRILGLEKIDEILKTSTDTIKKIEILVEQERQQVSVHSKELSDLKTPDLVNTNELEYLQIQLKKNEDLLLKAQKELNERNLIKDQLEFELKEKLKTLDQPLQEKSKLKVQFDFDSKAVLDKIKENELIKNDLNERFLSKVISVIKENTDLASKIELQRRNLCSECQRPWVDVASVLGQNQAKLEENELFLKASEDAKRIYKIKEELIDNSKIVFNKLKSDYEKSIYTLDTDFISRQSIVNGEFNQKINDLKLDVIKDGINDLNKVLFEVKIKINDLNNSQKVYDSKLSDYNKSKKALNAKISKSEDNLNQFQTAMALEEDLKELLGRKGFLGMIIGEILEELSGVVNQILSKIPNVSEVTIQIRPTTENDNSVKPKIHFDVFKKGIEIGISDLSGGQQASLEIAMDISLNNVIFRRLGIEVGWMIFDEAFNGLSSVDKSAVFEILKDKSKNSLILVVDHDDAFNSFFDKNIVLSFNGYNTEIISS